MSCNMSDKKIFTSAKKAVKKANKKAAVVFGSMAAVAAGLYITAQGIALKYVPEGVWNPIAYKQDWGTDGDIAFCSLVGAGIIGGLIALSCPPILMRNYRLSNTETEIDFENNVISQTTPIFYGLNVLSESIIFEYDTITAMHTKQSKSDKKDDLGTLVISAIRLGEAKDCDENNLGNSVVYTQSFTIPLQEKPVSLRNEIYGRFPDHKTLKEKLRA